MKGKILITDSIFIFKEHERFLEEAGYEIERLDKPNASEEELIEALDGKVGYILGGTEKVTDKVIEASKNLKAVVFTGTDAHAFISGFDLATQKGIAIANAPGANSYAVGEYVITLTLAMTRNIFELGRTGDKTFQTTHSLNELVVGIVGMGKIATRVATNLQSLGTKRIVYFSRTRKPHIEEQAIRYLPLDELLSTSDIVILLVPKSAGDGFLGVKELERMKDKALLVNIASRSLVDKEALFAKLQAGSLRAVQDGSADERFNVLPLSVWFHSNESTAYNTVDANKVASDMATQSILNLLEKGEDQYKMN